MECKSEIENLFEPYVLGALESYERARMEAHFETCADCAARLRQEGEVVIRLAEAAPRLEAPPRVKEALFSRIAAEYGPQPAPSQSWPLQRLAASIGGLLAARPGAVAAALLVAVLAVGGVWLNSRIDGIARDTEDLEGRIVAVADESAALVDKLATVSEDSAEVKGDLNDMLKVQTAAVERLDSQSQKAAEDMNDFTSRLDVLFASQQHTYDMVRDQGHITYVMSSPGTDVNMLKATEPTARARGMIAVSDTGQAAVLLALDLPPLPLDKVYQVWLIKGGRRYDGGVFTVDSNGYGQSIIQLFAPLGYFDAIGITVEPSGGSPGPTGDNILKGDL